MRGLIVRGFRWCVRGRGCSRVGCPPRVRVCGLGRVGRSGDGVGGVGGGGGRGGGGGGLEVSLRMSLRRSLGRMVRSSGGASPDVCVMRGRRIRSRNRNRSVTWCLCSRVWLFDVCRFHKWTDLWISLRYIYYARQIDALVRGGNRRFRCKYTTTSTSPITIAVRISIKKASMVNRII
jgi:hypothetical protein